MGIYTDFAHFSGFQLEKLLNLRGGGRGRSRRRVLCKEVNGKSPLGFTASSLASAGKRESYSHV